MFGNTRESTQSESPELEPKTCEDCCRIISLTTFNFQGAVLRVHGEIAQVHAAVENH